ncbi:PP2C family protein-serine/threonine phosphatase [Asanoa sp. WMMD1127]|uniref:PP2C family protein-serine/threonine phosphatase n=1 Tax=Asanoa sp. WMMD1127 TaxID=3016107 RepID=UPI002417BDA3|nr:PP2C family protein-serine/threonine phosphatase [Asanoa sp. WMMD1127]MDG4825796.1 PP2C family protein-serine/threonine phosphatase [Asanoa sp. WMMD1127]
MTGPTGRAQWRDALATLVEAGHLTGPAELGHLLAEAVAPTGAEVVLYLVDYEQRALRPVPPGRGGPEPVDGSDAGHAFAAGRPVAGPPAWLPVVNGTERLGVLRVTPPAGADPDALLAGARLVAGMAGHLITAKNHYGDDLQRIRRSGPMTPAADLLWRLLPPLTFANQRMVITASLEPCYDVGGDAFDYAVDGDVARLSIYDGVGKGMRAALTTAAAIGTSRAQRIAGADLAARAAAVDRMLLGEFTDSRFVTAVLAELSLNDGRLRYVNAGHPPPVLLRAGRAVRTLDDGNRTPLGVPADPPTVAETTLEPGDRLLLYTDGVTEARDPAGVQFGLDRLVDLVESVGETDLPAPETLRRLSHAVIDHQNGPPRDDATLVLLEWSAAAAHRAVP